jgi:hypothetical protein
MKKRNDAGPLKDLYRQTACIGPELAAGIYSAAGTDLGKMMRDSLDGSRFMEIVSASIDPRAYSNADTFSRDYLCVELMSKYPQWDLGIDRAGVALSKFLSVEEDLRALDFAANPRIVNGPKSTTMRAVIATARNKIQKILGEFSWDSAESLFTWGPGASTSLPRRKGDAAYKYGASEPQVSYNALPLASVLAQMYPLWSFNPTVVGGSRVVTVPKNAKTDRVIAIEPDLNMYFQKGIGRMIRRRLQRWGLLLKDAQERNQLLALEGSANGRLATVDLSSASDSIHLELVRLLLPTSWSSAIELCRTPFSILPSGERLLLRKVSSMGNGFTFELETLMFYGLVLAVIELLSRFDTDHRCLVFGDDIIVSGDLVPPLEEILGFVGFKTNLKKTFADGPFRESCGKHYFRGADVTPFFVRSPIDSVQRTYWAANQVRRYSRMAWGLDSRWKPVYDGVVSHLPPFWKSVKIPEGYGDGGLISDWDEASPSRARRGLQGWSYRYIAPRKRSFELDSVGTLLKSLHTLEGTDDELVPDWWFGSERETFDYRSDIGEDLYSSDINRPSGWDFRNKDRSGLAHQWPSYGPWV